MTSERARTKTHVSKRSVTRSLHTFNVDNINFLDEKEDACTQTCACATERSTPAQQLPSADSAYEEIKETDMTDMSFYEASPFCWSPAAVRTRTQFGKDKTPKSLKMLKEIHRENERLRHHSLNQHLRLICRKVPGSAESGKETKVVMMQRIISYVAYLENTARFMCAELGVKPNPTWLKVTSSLQDMDESETWKKEYLAVHSEDSRDSEVFSRNVSRHLTLSSPTIDSTTDLNGNSAFPFKRPRSNRQPSQESQDSSAATSSLSMDGDSSDAWQWIMSTETVVGDGSENFGTFFNNTDSDTSLFELPHPTFESKLMKSPEEVKWLASPDKSPFRLQGKLYEHCGIKCDSKYFEEQPADFMHTLIVSPDQVIPQATVKEEVVVENKVTADAYSCSNFLFKDSNRLEQSLARRAPLLNVTNWLEVPNFLGEDHYDSQGCIFKQDDTGHSVEVNSCSQADAGCRMNAAVTVEMLPQTIDIVATHKVQEDSEGIQARPCSEEPRKIDFRRSSWMNGFMMYSHIHRKQLIRERPGLHASVISKLLGHRWRGMTSEQQQPYREQARLCSQELQKRLCQTGH
ncbi:hypothetical protein BsWGS_15438 [Bradybaena similaris]